MTGEEFAQEVARKLGLAPLTEREVNAILDIASVAAHSSERLAAPLSTYLAGRSGRSLDDVMAAVQAVQND